MRNVTVIFLSLIILWVSLSCSRTQEVDPCPSAVEISAKEGCHDSVLGLLLTVSGLTRAEGAEWRVYAAEDTTSANLINLQINKGTSDNKLYVPNSILDRYPMIIVQATAACGNSSVQSTHYSFVRRGSDNCVTWVRKNL